jgi:hypothetical protein
VFKPLTREAAPRRSKGNYLLNDGGLALRLGRGDPQKGRLVVVEAGRTGRLLGYSADASDLEQELCTSAPRRSAYAPDLLSLRAPGIAIPLGLGELGAKGLDLGVQLTRVDR